MSVSSSSPLVSVVIAAYNAAADLRTTLSSLRAQTYAHFEAIIVDDGSTDGTAAIAESFARADSRFRLIRQANAGVGAARNTAIGHALGTYIAPLDADDIWDPEKLEKQVAVMEKAGPDVGMVYCWSRRIDANGKFLSYSHPYAVEGRIRRALILRNLLSNASVPLFRRSAISEVGPYLTRTEQRGGQGCEDWDMNLRVAEKYVIRCVPEYLVGYRQRPSCMSVNAEMMTKSYEVVIARARARSPDLPKTLFRWSAGAFYFYLTSKSYQWGRYRWTLHAGVRALKADPILLLSPRMRRFTFGSVFHLLTHGRFRRTPIPPPSPIDLIPVPSEGNTRRARDMIERVELRRWSLATAA